MNKSVMDCLLLLISGACLVLCGIVMEIIPSIKIPLLIGGIIIIVLAIFYGISNNRKAAKYGNKPKSIFYEGATAWIITGFYIMSIANVAVCLVYGVYRLWVLTGHIFEPTRPVIKDDGTMDDWC